MKLRMVISNELNGSPSIRPLFYRRGVSAQSRHVVGTRFRRPSRCSLGRIRRPQMPCAVWTIIPHLVLVALLRPSRPDRTTTRPNLDGRLMRRRKEETHIPILCYHDRQGVPSLHISFLTRNGTDPDTAGAVNSEDAVKWGHSHCITGPIRLTTIQDVAWH